MLRLCFFVALFNGMITVTAVTACISYGTGYQHTYPTAPVISIHILRHRLLYSSGNSCPFLRNETHICTLCSRVSHSAYTWSHKVQWLSFLSRTANVSRLNIIPCAFGPIICHLKNTSAFLPRRTRRASAFHCARQRSSVPMHA